FLSPDLKPHRRRSRLLPIASIFVLVPLLAPLVMEALALSYAQWRDLLGTPVVVRTPFLDAIGEGIETVRADFSNALSSRFQQVPWNPRIVLPIATVITALAIVMLRV